MKGKRRGRGNPFAEYRRVQAEIRGIFDPFTERHCPTCATPCCIKPSKVTPVDVSLAVGAGHTFPHFGASISDEVSARDRSSVGETDDSAFRDSAPYAAALSNAAYRLSPAGVPLGVVNELSATYCEFLNNGRCSFPNDLRPFGCTTYICDPMYKNLPDEVIRRLRRLIRQLETAHVALIHALRDAGRLPDPTE